jgi:hypothetical protein
MLLYHRHASVKDKRHPHVDEESPGRFECALLTRNLCIVRAIQVLAKVACHECYSCGRSMCPLHGEVITPLASSEGWFREAGIHVIDSTYPAPVFA